MKRKIYITLIGGLGNQLFQYSCAYNLAKKLKANLIIDDRSGFFFDTKFKRNISLPKNLSYQKANILQITLLLILRILKKIFFKKNIFISTNKFIFIDETNTKRFIKNFYNLVKNKNSIYLLGFFQSEKYFLETKNEILKKILTNKIYSKDLKLLKKIINKKSLMIGIRMFEEAPTKIMKQFGGIENFNFYLDKIKIIKKKISIKKKFIFSTMSINLINKKLDVPKKFIINKENGFKGDDMDYLILISNFKNYIISNSTFYYWGALLSEFKNKKINIICSKKFTNSDAVSKKWKTLN